MPSELAISRLAAVLPLLVTLGCWGQGVGCPAAEADAARRDTVRATSTRKPAEISEPINRFGVDLYGKLAGGKNLVLSPASISSVMAMAYSGSRNQTAREIAHALHFSSPPEQLHLAFAAFDPGRRVLDYSFGARVMENQGYGLKVTEVLPQSPAANHGLKPNDLILTINGRPIRSEASYTEAIDRCGGKIRIQWFSYRRGSVDVREVSLPVASTAPEPPTKLEMVNAVWGQKGYDFNPRYVDLVKTHYQGHFGQLDFKAQPGQSRQFINRWVEEKTHGRIGRLLGEEAVTSDSRLILTNTIYFKGEWKHPFSTYERGLNWQVGGVSGGQVVRVEAMSQNNVFNYRQTPQFQAVELPYKESSLALVLLLPRPDLPWREFQTVLETPDFLAGLRGLQPTRVRLVLPKFRIRTNLPLTETLKPAMPEAFSEEADFSGMCQRGKLKISAIVHMAYISVDEKGTEAGAATAASITAKAPPEAEFIANRPFTFLLHDRTTRTILFLGHLIAPVP